MKRSGFNQINSVGYFFSRLLKEERKLNYLIYRAKWNWLAKLHYCLRFPTHLDIETTNHCNLRCVMCPHSFPEGEFNKNLAFLDSETVYNLIDEGAQKSLNSIKLHMRGEPLIDKRMPDFIAYAKKKGITEVSINSNGQLMNKDLSKRLIESRLDMIVLAVDGNSQETYNNLRVGGDFERLVRNIEDLLNLKIKYRLKRPIIRLQFLKVDTNKHEINDFIARWNNRVDSLSIKDCSNRGETEDRLTETEYNKYGRLPCPQLWQRLLVTCHKEVLMCCKDWHCQNTIDVLDYKNGTTIEKIWRSEKLNRIRRLHLNNELNKVGLCQNCTFQETYLWKKIKGHQ